MITFTFYLNLLQYNYINKHSIATVALLVLLVSYSGTSHRSSLRIIPDSVQSPKGNVDLGLYIPGGVPVF